MDTDGILCYRCLTKRGESTDSFDVGMGEIERSANLNNSVAKWRQQLVELTSRLGQISAAVAEKKRQQQEAEDKAAALLRKQWIKEEQNNQVSVDENRKVNDEEIKSTKVFILWITDISLPHHFNTFFDFTIAYF